MKTRSLFLSLVLLCITVPNLNAAEYVFEKPHTQILFFCDHLGFSKSKGEFLDFDGKFSFNPEKPEQASVEMTISTSSIEMHDADWNAHLKNEDFFNVEVYPHITFRSSKIVPSDENHATLHGNLTLLGITKPVTFEVTHNKSGKHPFSGEYIAGFTVTGVIRRSDFGMTYGIPALGDDIEIRMSVEGIQQSP